MIKKQETTDSIVSAARIELQDAEVSRPPAVPVVDTNEGLGGSYVRQKDGTRVLVSRTQPSRR